ncbi:MAG TPA: 1-(5-phosphoribosyl)-5-((5-phosphoribosylamino)methylideneamino)imidazole-4-carboxamide isomerase [Spongiibacteraceae bacterium]|nr:1-(5-phosphoribosyl)-5-((5-phosphoribosylamino)methylideneamino)imidazole-4-carboxamide isomerase [Spongiibacteraceae bacterium]HCS28952.1 1-(5-phosphoribosyl)-5-((5-phosphoribosylamino)methylideneamino)imidazole-4-carboxamide isomerase [Spongiibacteraceae bacterium]|tara:strand:- start:2340 stop:2738 length:399 start_codon:yes stop_codon:yes gene_type:complete
MTSITPTGIELHQKSRELELIYADGERVRLSCELLRVLSPSAEVRGHGKGQEVLQTGKINVAITDIKPVGNYAIQLSFSDGHDSGIFSWAYLRELADNKEAYWQTYLDQLHQAGASRDPEVQVVKFFDAGKP